VSADPLPGSDRVISLWDLMKRFHAADFMMFADALSKVASGKPLGRRSSWVLRHVGRYWMTKQDNDGLLVSAFEKLRGTCNEMELFASVATIDKILQTLALHDVTSIAYRGAELSERMKDELGARDTFCMSVTEARYFNSPLIGWETVVSRFSQMIEDIDEAGKCLSVNRTTATVFHLMRIMEIAVQHLGTKLGVTLTQEKNWQNILDEVNAAIKKMHPKSDETKKYAAAASHLYNVKLAWRNEVMHPKQTYTLDEAETIYLSVRAFAVDVAGFV
jgi:hypothetical protein